MYPFFIGYKAMPALLKKHYLMLIIVALLSTAMIGYSLAKHQMHAGHGVWETGELTTIEGLLTVEPYPMLHRTTNTPDTETESVMLVSLGKHSAKPPAAEHAGKLVSVTGYSVSRGGWLMLELADDSSIRPLADQSGAAAATAGVKRESRGEIKLSGEIIDSKCFLGVMKPGHGPVHQACAELCLLGGIPPMLVVKDTSNQQFGYLLTESDGTSAALSMAPRAAESVEIFGELEKHGDMLYIRVNQTQSVQN